MIFKVEFLVQHLDQYVCYYVNIGTTFIAGLVLLTLDLQGPLRIICTALQAGSDHHRHQKLASVRWWFCGHK